jgi:hypothetical protein
MHPSCRPAGSVVVTPFGWSSKETAALGILYSVTTAFGVRVAEKDEDGITDVLVDRPAKLQSDLRHLSQIMVEELGQILGFEPLSRLRKAFEIGEKDR